MNLLRQAIGIQKAVLAGRSLTCHHRTHFGSGTAGLQTFLRQECPERLDPVKRHTHDLQRQTGGHHHIPAAELLRRLRDLLMLRHGDLAVFGDHAHVEFIGALIVQTAQRLDTGDLLRRHRHHTRLICHLHHIEEGRPFQHLRIRIAIAFQPVLQQIGPLALRAHKQKFLVFTKPRHFALHF